MARDKGTGSVYYDESKKVWRGSFEAGWTANGTRRRVKVSAKTKRACLQKLRDRQAEVLKGGLPTEGVRRSETVKSYGEEWLEVQKTRVDPDTWSNHRTSIRKWIVPTIGHRRLEQMASKDVRAVANAIMREGLKESTAQRTQVVLKKMLKDAVRDGYTVPQSALETESIERNETDREPIPLIDAKAILYAAQSQPDFSRWLAAFYAALRPAEARGLTWDRVDFDRYALEVSWQLKQLRYNIPRDRNSGFRVPRGYEARQIVDAYHLVRPKTKSGDRWIPMVPPLRDALLAWRDECPGQYDLVWPNLTGKRKTTIGRPREDKPDREVWKFLCDEARAWKNVETQQPYDLYEARHTAASMLREAGASDEVITLIMGHSSILSTKAYIHISMEKAGQMLAGMSSVLTPQKRPEPKQLAS